jgi:putative hemolysin
MMTLHLKNVAILIVLALALILAALPAIMEALPTTIPVNGMDASQHASDKHGWLLAQSIMDCISKNGPHMNMKFRDKNGKFYVPCQLPDGSIGLGIFDKNGNNISAYVPGDGSWEHVKNYILQRAARFTGPLPW